MNARPERSTTAGTAYLDLRALAKDTHRPTDELLQLYALEGFLDRLTHSEHADTLVLKGGVLLAAYDFRRPTRDIDFAATDIGGDLAALQAMTNDILAIDRNDGLAFDLSATTVAAIREDDSYPSARAKISGTLSTARIRLHVDINIGDPLWPEPHQVDIPRLLGGEPLRLTGYRVELVLAEKIVTAAQRGTANTRWRDFVDIARLSTTIWTATYSARPLNGSVELITQQAELRDLTLTTCCSHHSSSMSPRIVARSWA